MADLLPEQTEYRDEGCRAHPSCLSCPLAVCIEEERFSLRDGGMSRRRTSLRARDMEIVGLFGEGWPVKRLGDTYGLSRRQVFRILAIERESAALDGGVVWTSLRSSGSRSRTRGRRRTA